MFIVIKNNIINILFNFKLSNSIKFIIKNIINFFNKIYINRDLN